MSKRRPKKSRPEVTYKRPLDGVTPAKPDRLTKQFAQKMRKGREVLTYKPFGSLQDVTL